MSYSVTVNVSLGSLALDSSAPSGFAVGVLPTVVHESPSISLDTTEEPALAPQIQKFRNRRNKDEERKQTVLAKMPQGWLRDQNIPPEPLPPELAGPEPAAVYRRISTPEQKDSSMDRQGGVESYARLINCNIAFVYDDKGKSGRFKAGRPDFIRMMKDAETGKFKKLILEFGNRLSRDLGLTTSVFRDLRRWGVEIHTPTEGKWHLLHAAFNGVMGQEALENLKIWTRAGLERTVLDGKFPGIAPYGFYKKPGYPGELYEDKEKAERVRWMYSMRSVGVPAAEIRRLLNAQGHPSPKGKKWSTFQVLAILRNPIYIGLLIYFRTKTEKSETNSYTIVKKVETTPMSAWRVSERPDWEIVKVDVWNKVQQLNQRNTNQRKRGAVRLLSGIVYCSHCACPMHTHARRGSHVRLHCSDATRRRAEATSKVGSEMCLSRTSVLMQCVEATVIKAAAERLLAVGAHVTAEKAYKSSMMKELEQTVLDRKKLEADKKGILEKHAATFDAAYTNDMPAAAITLLRAKLNEALENVEVELAALPLIEIPKRPLQGVDFKGLAGFLQDLSYCKDFDVTDERESRMVAAFQELIGRIEIKPLSARSFNLTIRGPLAHIGRAHLDADPVLLIEARDAEVTLPSGHSASRKTWRELSVADIRIKDDEWARMAPSLPRGPIWVEGYPKPVELRQVIDLLLFKHRAKVGFSYFKHVPAVAAHWDHPVPILHAAFQIAKFWNVIDLFACLALTHAPRLVDGIKIRLTGRRSSDIEDIPAAFDRRNSLKMARALDPNVKLSLPKLYLVDNALM